MKLHSLCRLDVYLNHISHVHHFVPAECLQFPERPVKLDLDGQFLSLMKLLKGSLAMAVALFRRLLRVPWDFSTCYHSCWSSCSRRGSRTCATSLAHRLPMCSSANWHVLGQFDGSRVPTFIATSWAGLDTLHSVATCLRLLSCSCKSVSFVKIWKEDTQKISSSFLLLKPFQDFTMVADRLTFDWIL